MVKNVSFYTLYLNIQTYLKDSEKQRDKQTTIQSNNHPNQNCPIMQSSTKPHKTTASNYILVDMRKLPFAALIIFLLSISLSITAVNANPTPNFPSIIITAPTHNKIAYSGSSINIEYDLYLTNSSSDLSTIYLSYSLDGGSKVSIPNNDLTDYRLYEEGHSPIVYSGVTNITGIANGEHKVTIYAKTTM
jgi:hypothetical protein